MRELAIQKELTNNDIKTFTGAQLKTLLCVSRGIPQNQSGLGIQAFKAAYEVLYTGGWITVPWKKYLLMVRLDQDE